MAYVSNLFTHDAHGATVNSFDCISPELYFYIHICYNSSLSLLHISIHPFGCNIPNKLIMIMEA